MISIVDQTPYC